MWSSAKLKRRSECVLRSSSTGIEPNCFFFRKPYERIICLFKFTYFTRLLNTVFTLYMLDCVSSKMLWVRQTAPMATTFAANGARRQRWPQLSQPMVHADKQGVTEGYPNLGGGGGHPKKGLQNTVFISICIYTEEDFIYSSQIFTSS